MALLAVFTLYFQREVRSRWVDHALMPCPESYPGADRGGQCKPHLRQGPISASATADQRGLNRPPLSPREEWRHEVGMSANGSKPSARPIRRRERVPHE